MLYKYTQRSAYAQYSMCVCVCVYT